MRVLLLMLFMFSLSCWAAPLPAENKQPPANEKKEQGKSEQPKTEAALPPPVIQIRNEVAGYRGEQTTAKEDKHPDEILAWRATAVAAGIAFLALVVAGVQVWFFKDQLGKMERSLADSKIMAIAAEKSADAGLRQATYLQQSVRAYVIAGHETKVGLREEKFLTVEIEIKNFGQTPARQVICHTSIGVYPYPLVVLLDPEAGPNPSKSPLAPSQTIKQFPTLEKPLTEAHLDALIAKQAAIYVWGKISYIDVFNIEQHTTFCLYCTGDDLDGGHLAYYPKGNNAT
jgi:hypothetical protein